MIFSVILHKHVSQSQICYQLKYSANSIHIRKLNKSSYRYANCKFDCICTEACRRTAGHSWPCALMMLCNCGLSARLCFNIEGLVLFLYRGGSGPCVKVVNLNLKTMAVGHCMATILWGNKSHFRLAVENKKNLHCNKKNGHWDLCIWEIITTKNVPF